jgi:hypothetical protein
MSLHFVASLLLAVRNLLGCSEDKQKTLNTYLYVSSDPFLRVPTPPFFVLRTASSCL